MAKYKRIGYYNDREDIINLSDSTRDEIVNYTKSGLGHFYPTDNEDEEYDFKDFDVTTISGNNGDKYIVQSSIATDINLISQDDFIDIYEKIDSSRNF